MGQHWSHLTPTKRIQLDAFIRAGMKPTDIAKELGVHHTTIYRELKRCTYEHLNSDYTTETRYNPEGAQARYEANLRAKGPELKIGNDYELADYRPSELVKVDMLLNGEQVDALSFIAHKDKAYPRARKLCEKLKENIPRQLF